MSQGLSNPPPPKKKPARRASRAPKSAPAPRKSPPRNTRSAGASGRWTAIVLALVGLLASFLAVGWLAIVHGFGRAPGPGTGAQIELDWPSGLSSKEAAERLEREGLVGSASLFSLYLRLTGGGSAFRPGPHLLRDDLSPRDLVRRLERSPSRGRAKVTLPEGVHRFEIARRMQQAGICGARAFLEATTDPELLRELGIEGDSAEGFLFPATYEPLVDSDARDVVRRLKAELDKRLDRLEQAHAPAWEELRETFGWSRRELVILASIVEKEAAVDEERPLVASVFLNRLRDPSFLPRKRLQSDATTAYGCVAEPEQAPSCASYAGRVMPEMNNDAANRYSTYRHSDLPPGPIANPGESSLEAVLAPATTKYLYFVAKGQGRHAFSETLDQHRDAIRGGR